MGESSGRGGSVLPAVLSARSNAVDQESGIRGGFRPFWKKSAAVCALCLVLGLSAGSALGAESVYMQTARPTLPPAIPEAVFAYITVTSPYAKWRIMPGSTMFRTGVEPHDLRQNIHVNPTAYSALRAKSGTLPEGAIMVKEIYGENKKILRLAVMYKPQGSGPGAADRLWVSYAPDGTVLSQGAEGGCVSCHAPAKNSDFVLFKASK